MYNKKVIKTYIIADSENDWNGENNENGGNEGNNENGENGVDCS